MTTSSNAWPQEKGVGVLVRPAPTPVFSAQGAGEEDPNATEASSAAAPSIEPESKPARRRAPTPRAKMKTVNLELPDYVWTDLKIRAARKQTSLRHIVMAALKAAGVEIAEADMIEDGRRLRT